jgi:transcriptional regulator with XRE-family HTH domain
VIDELADLVARAENAAQTRDEAIRAAYEAGASQSEIAVACGMSRSAVQRLLAGETSTAARPLANVDEDEAEFHRQMREEQMKQARLRTAREATRLKLQQDAAAALAEANAMTAIGPLDVDDE